MKTLVAVLLLGVVLGPVPARAEVHVWEKVDLTFHARNSYANPYTA